MLDTTTASIRLVELFNHLLVLQNCADLSFTAFTPIFASLSDILNTLYLIFSEVNRDGLEVPCIYRLYGPKTYVERARTMLSGDQSRVQSSGVSGPSQSCFVTINRSGSLLFSMGVFDFVHKTSSAGLPYFRGRIIQL